MKTLIALCVINKDKPRIDFNNLIPLKEKNNIRLLKGEKIIEVVIKQNE